MPQLSFDAKTGQAVLSTPIKEFLISAPHLIKISTHIEDGTRITEGEFDPMGTFQITTDPKSGNVTVNTHDCIVNYKDSDDKSFIVATIYPGTHE